MAVIYGSQVQPHLSFSVCPQEEITEHAALFIGCVVGRRSWGNERKDGRREGCVLYVLNSFGPTQKKSQESYLTVVHCGGGSGMSELP